VTVNDSFFDLWFNLNPHDTQELISDEEDDVLLDENDEMLID